MIVLRRITYQLNKLKEDPVTVMAVESEVRTWLPNPFYSEFNRYSQKEWIGHVHKKTGLFSVKRFSIGVLGPWKSSVVIIGERHERSNKFEITIKPSVIFYLNLIGIPALLFLIFQSLSFGLTGLIITFLSLILVLAMFVIDLNKSVDQIIKFMDSLLIIK